LYARVLTETFDDESLRLAGKWNKFQDSLVALDDHAWKMEQKQANTESKASQAPDTDAMDISDPQPWIKQ
jgi:hypothetical protein